MPSLRDQSITFTGTSDAKEPVNVCLNMWNVFIPTGAGQVFLKKDITLVDTKIDINLRPGMMISVMSEGVIPGTTSCTAQTFSRPGTVGTYRIVIPVININASTNETGTAGALLATVIVSYTIPMLYDYAGTF